MPLEKVAPAASNLAPSLIEPTIEYKLWVAPLSLRAGWPIYQIGPTSKVVPRSCQQLSFVLIFYLRMTGSCFFVPRIPPSQKDLRDILHKK